MNRLVTIPISHFCEKARWALDHAQVPYVEEGHVPVLHWHATTLHRTRTVPMLLTDGAVLKSSGAILRWADVRCLEDRHLYPNDPHARREVEELEAHFDAKLGPAARRWAYSHVLPLRGLCLEMLGAGVPSAERALLAKGFPMIRALMQRGMGVDAAGAARSLERIRATFAEVGARLSDGRRFLVGDRFTAADLTFAALAIPVLAPPSYPWIPAWESLPSALREQVRLFRETPAGAFGLRVYREHRARRVVV